MSANLMPIYHEANVVLALDDRKLWLYLNNKKWGFIKDRGIYCHRRSTEKFNREIGFYVPKVLLHKKITFEVHVKEDSYSTWCYDPGMKQRMLPTDPLVFLSLARLTWTKDAIHVSRPR
jgi:hypothetical protein